MKPLFVMSDEALTIYRRAGLTENQIQRISTETERAMRGGPAGATALSDSALKIFRRQGLTEAQIQEITNGSTKQPQ